MSKTSELIYIIIIGIFLAGCKEKYEPVLKPGQKNFLVVEGILNASGATTIHLSRTSELNEHSNMTSEGGATVLIVGNDGSQTGLTETSPGIYEGELLLQAANTYNLHIRTAEGKDYESAMQSVKQTPPIDSVSWNRTDKNVDIRVSTKDPFGQTSYYKWDYVETWEFHSPFAANYVYNGSIVVARDPLEIPLLYTCWNNQTSASILIGTSKKLAANVISNAPLLTIANGDERLSVRYSILVRQYAIDENTYNFYQQLKSNTESLGSIFDALPTDISGNITCVTNPSEKVIGYVSAASIQEKRLFIANSEVPDWGFTPQCETLEVPNTPLDFANNYPPYAPFEPITFGVSVVAYKSAAISCVDCRTRGTNNRPSFW